MSIGFRTNFVQDEETGAFTDGDVVVLFHGQEFTAGGAWLMQRIDTGKFAGSVYVVEEGNKYFVSNFDGKIRIAAQVGASWKSNLGDTRRAVWFRYKGKQFYGMWCNINYNQLVNVKEVK